MSGASDPVAWVEKARQDARSARRPLVDPPEVEAAAYHVQQAVEKAIKAVLTTERIGYPRGRGAGHDLDAMARLIPADDPLRNQALMLSGLTVWATAFRYPADDPMTAEPLPPRDDVERRLDEAEAFVEAVAGRAVHPPRRGDAIPDAREADAPTAASRFRIATLRYR